jgi:hypothetical protein
VFSNRGEPVTEFSCKVDGYPAALAVGPRDAICIISTKVETVKLDEPDAKRLKEVDAELSKLRAMQSEGRKKMQEAERAGKLNPPQSEKQFRPDPQVLQQTRQLNMEKMGLLLKTRKPVSFCTTFDGTGKETRRIQLAQDVPSAATAAICRGRLLLSDRATKTVNVFDLADGQQVATIGDDLATAYGIVGFAIDKRSDDILIANTAAFRVDRYARDGRKLSSFGHTDKTKAESPARFTPTNLVVLPDGRLLTAEKMPTRLKIFSADGKKCEQVVADPGGLLSGCDYIPMASDSAGLVYLANSAKGYVVKCTKS